MSVADVIAGRLPWHVEAADCLEVLRGLPEGCVQACVTSPPYYALRDYGVAGQVGLEPTPEAYVARLVEVFREVRRVLRHDGTLWLNIGDSYAAGGSGGHATSGSFHGHSPREGVRLPKKAPAGIKPKDLIGVPWMLAFALRADGWYLRSEILWCKTSPMPDSVRDRPTRAHEQVFLLTRSARYFYDQEAERVASSPVTLARDKYSRITPNHEREQYAARHDHETPSNPAGRNLWSYWADISPSPDSVGHFALMPLDLARRCLRLGTSARGCCPACGAPWRRVVEQRKADVTRTYYAGAGQHGADGRRLLPERPGGFVGAGSITAGWRPSCACPSAEPVPCLALDPFAGAGTTGLAARGLGRRFLGAELNSEYAEIARRRIGAAAPLLDACDEAAARPAAEPAEPPTLFDESRG